MTRTMTIVIDGTTMDHNPTEYAPQKVIFGNEQRNLDRSLGFQVMGEKYIFTLDNITVTNWQVMLRIFSNIYSPVTYRDGIYIVQALNGDGATTSFRLERMAYTGTTDHTAWIDGIQKSVTFTAATNPGATQVFINNATGVATTGVTPADSFSNFQIYYQPIYYVKQSTDVRYLPNIIYGYATVLKET